MATPAQTWHARIRRLGKRQRAVLDQCARSNTWGHPPRIMAALVRQGLLREDVTTYRDAGGPYEAHQWYMPLEVHAAWCQVGRNAPAPDRADDA